MNLSEITHTVNLHALLRNIVSDMENWGSMVNPPRTVMYQRGREALTGSTAGPVHKVEVIMLHYSRMILIWNRSPVAQEISETSVPEPYIRSSKPVTGSLWNFNLLDHLPGFLIFTENKSMLHEVDITDEPGAFK